MFKEEDEDDDEDSDNEIEGIIAVETVQDFLIKFDIKPLMHLLKISIFFTK